MPKRVGERLGSTRGVPRSGTIGYMNWMGFVATVIGHLAWPTALVALMILFRRPVTNLLAQLRSFKGFGTEATFGAALAAAESKIEAATAEAAAESRDEEQHEHDDGRESQRDAFMREIEANPSFGVIAAWERVQQTVAQMSAAVALAEGGTPPARNTTQQIRLLVQKGAISEQVADALTELRALRNDVVHAGTNPTPAQALAYAENAYEIERNLHSRMRHPGFAGRWLAHGLIPEEER